MAMQQPTAVGTCPSCGLTRLPLTPGGRVKAHYTPGARGHKCRGGKPSEES